VELVTAIVLLLATSLLAAQGPRSETSSFYTSVLKPVHLRDLIDLTPGHSATEGSCG
jgi:hypothetical protein